MSPFNLAGYQFVEVRIAEFWQDNPAGRIHTHLVKHDAGEYIVHAMVFRDFQSKDPDATGYAQERETAKGVNSTSALENCETSAIGRALANLGYAAKGKRPSREEMSKASGGLQGFGEGLQNPPEEPSESAEGRPLGPADEASGDATATPGAPANHLHGPWSDKRPDGAPMRDGWLRCEGCGQASLRKSVA